MVLGTLSGGVPGRFSGRFGKDPILTVRFPDSRTYSDHDSGVLEGKFQGMLEVLGRERFTKLREGYGRGRILKLLT